MLMPITIPEYTMLRALIQKTAQNKSRYLDDPWIEPREADALTEEILTLIRIERRLVEAYEADGTQWMLRPEVEHTPF